MSGRASDSPGPGMTGSYIDPEFLAFPPISEPGAPAANGGSFAPRLCRRQTRSLILALHRYQTILAMVGCLVIYHHTFAPAASPRGAAAALPNLVADRALESKNVGGHNDEDINDNKTQLKATSDSAAGSPRPAHLHVGRHPPALSLPAPPPPRGLEGKGESDGSLNLLPQEKDDRLDASEGQGQGEGEGEGEGQGWLQPDVAHAQFEVYAVRVSSPHRVLGRGVVLFVTPTVPGLTPLGNMTHHTGEPHGLPQVHRYLRSTTPILGDYIDGSCVWWSDPCPTPHAIPASSQHPTCVPVRSLCVPQCQGLGLLVCHPSILPACQCGRCACPNAKGLDCTCWYD